MKGKFKMISIYFSVRLKRNFTSDGTHQVETEKGARVLYRFGVTFLLMESSQSFRRRSAGDWLRPGSPVRLLLG